MLLLQLLVDHGFFLLELSQNLLGSRDKFIFSLVRLIKFALIGSPILFVLNEEGGTLSILMPLVFLLLRHSAVTLAKFFP